MMVMNAGLERTEAQYQIFLEAVGLKLVQVVPAAAAMSVIEALPG